MTKTKLIYEFEFEDANDFKIITRAHDFFCELCDIDAALRARIKYGTLSEETERELQSIRDMIISIRDLE